MNKFIKTISIDNVGYEFLKSLNGILELTNREIELLSAFLEIHVSRHRKSKKAIDCTENRKLVMLALGITKDNLCRYIQKFVRKKIFVIENRLLTINRALIPQPIGNRTIQITMILKIKQNELLQQEEVIIQ